MFGVYSSFRAASKIRSRISGETRQSGLEFSTLDTLPGETPAREATSRILLFDFLITAPDLS
jgi:hypothetical protein